jgi:hypothetical protein
MNNFDKTGRVGGKIMSGYVFLRSSCSILLLCAAITIMVPFFAEAKIWTYEKLTDNSTNDYNPKIYQDQITWMGYKDALAKFGILTMNLKERDVVEVTAGMPGFPGTPSIYGDTIAFRIWDRLYTHRYYLWQNGTATQIFERNIGSFPPIWGYPPSYGSIEPYLYKDKVAIAGWDGNDYEIFLVKDGLVSQVTDNDTDDYEPQIYEEAIVWTGWGGDDITQEDVFQWDGNTTINMSQAHKGKDEDAHIYAQKIVYAGRAYDYNDSLFDIYINEENVIKHVHYMKGNDFEPYISESMVAWHNYNPADVSLERYYRTYLWDGYKLFHLNAEPHDTLGPHIYDENVILRVSDGNDFEIYLATYLLGKYSPTLSTQNGIRKLVTDGSVLYIAQRNGLSIVDISDPQKPQETAVLKRNSLVFDIEKDGNYIYLAEREAGIGIIDVSDQYHPIEIQTIDTIGRASALTVHNDLLLVGDKEGDLLIFDISSPGNIQKISSLPLPGHAYGTTVVGNYAYVACYYGGMCVVDISDPLTPRMVYWNSKIGFTWSMKEYNGYLYVLSPNYGIHVLDIDDPLNPQILASLTLPAGAKGGWSPPFDIKFVNGYAFVGNGTDGVLVIDVLNPLEPIIVERFETPGFAWGIAIKNNLLLAADGNSLRIYDIADYLF